MNRDFTLEMHQIFFVHNTLDEFENVTITGRFGFAFRKTRSGKSRDYREVIGLEKLRFQNEKTTESFHIEHLKPELNTNKLSMLVCRCISKFIYCCLQVVLGDFLLFYFLSAFHFIG